MTPHITDEDLLDVLNGQATERVTTHLVTCESCWREVEALNGSISRFASTMRSEAALAETATLHRPVRVRAVSPGLRWAMAAAAGLVLAAVAMLSSPQPSTSVVAERHGASAVQQARIATPLTQQTPAAQRQTAEQERADDALLMQVQDDMDREMPAALQPVALIVAERNQFAERLTQTSQGENE